MQYKLSTIYNRETQYYYDIENLNVYACAYYNVESFITRTYRRVTASTPVRVKDVLCHNNIYTRRL